LLLLGFAGTAAGQFSDRRRSHQQLERRFEPDDSFSEALNLRLLLFDGRLRKWGFPALETLF
jgi:hypothetical protein